MTITLFIPDKALSPNARINAIKKSTITRRARQTAFFATLRALGVPTVPARILMSDRRKLGITHAKPLRSEDYKKVSTLLLPGQPPAFTSYSLAFHFPQERNRDDDNAAASCKAYRDGIADALRIDDSSLRMESLSTNIDRERPRLEITLNVIGHLPTCSPALDPLRTAYSRAEILQKMEDWMLENEGHPLTLESERREQWYRDNGMIYAFLSAQFPFDITP